MAQIKTPCNQAHNRCNDKKSPAIRYEQTTLPCSVGISKFYTGKIEGNNFEGDLTLVTPNVELLTVDKDFFEILDVPLDECGGKLRVKGHSHITLNKDFKKQLDLLAREGGFKVQFENILNTREFKYFFVTYLRRLVEDNILTIRDIFPNTPITTPQPPVINTGLDCNTLTNCPIIQDIIRRLNNLEGTSIQPPIVQPPVNNNYPILDSININLDQGVNTYNIGNIIPSFYNSNGDTLIKSITILGGDTSRFLFRGNPVYLNQVIPVSELNNFVFLGNINSELNIQAQSFSNKNSNMAKIRIIFKPIVDTFERCIRVSNNTSNNNYNIIRRASNSTVFGSITFTNSCNTSYTIPEQVLINEDGLRVTIPSFVLGGKTSETKQFSIQGAYTGTKNNITGNVIINGTPIHINVIVTEPNTAPVSNDITVESNNRVNTTITTANLNWSDRENDPLEKVKIIGNITNLYIDSGYNTLYVSGTELEPNFTLYVKAPDQDTVATFEYDYFVKAGGQWSN